MQGMRAKRKSNVVRPRLARHSQTDHACLVYACKDFANSLRSKENEDLTPNMRGDNSQSRARGFRAGWTYRHHRRSRASAKPNAERQHDIHDNHGYRSNGA
jgi:hypothetical protein